LAWCQVYDRAVLRVTRGELEMYVRHLEGRAYAAATVARRFGTVATFYKYAVIDGIIPASPAAAVTRPKVAWEGQERTVLHPLEFAALLAAARTLGPNDHALVCLLGMLGLRVSEACATDITDLRYEAGYELLHVLGKGAKPADIPLPIPVLRAVREAVDGRTAGPILRTRTGRRMDRAGASRALTRVAHAAGIAHVAENEWMWRSAVLDASRLAFGDNGAGDPFCLVLDGDAAGAVEERSAVDLGATRSWPNLAKFWTDWLCDSDQKCRFPEHSPGG
jgi:site-specific recombinase XerD